MYPHEFQPIRAVALAGQIIHGRLRAPEIDDDGWNLLLLAAGVKSASAPPLVVSCKVLNNAQLRAGYFGDVRDDDAATSAAQ